MDDTAKTLNYVKVFFLILFLATIVSLSLKLFFIVSSSKFTSSSFNILYINKNSYLIHIERGKKLSVIEYPQNKALSTPSNRISQSIMIGMPISAYIIAKHENDYKPDINFIGQSTLISMLTKPFEYKLVNMNDMDLVKAFLYTKGISTNNKGFSIMKSPDPTFSSGSFAPSLFDTQIFNEKQSVQIINATGVDGLGTKLATMLKNAGYNVISVESGDQTTSSIHAASKKSESVRQLVNFFNLPLIESNDNSIADITVVLSSDLIKN